MPKNMLEYTSSTFQFTELICIVSSACARFLIEMAVVVPYLICCKIEKKNTIGLCLLVAFGDGIMAEVL